MTDEVTLTLSRDEALVLIEWLHRLDAEAGRHFEDQAEQRVLWDLECMLESALEDVLVPGYAQRLAEARARVRDPVE